MTPRPINIDRSIPMTMHPGDPSNVHASQYCVKFGHKWLDALNVRICKWCGAVVPKR